MRKKSYSKYIIYTILQAGYTQGMKIKLSIHVTAQLQPKRFLQLNGCEDKKKSLLEVITCLSTAFIFREIQIILQKVRSYKQGTNILKWRFKSFAVPFTNIASKINDGHHPAYTLLNTLISLIMCGNKT